MQLWRFLPMVPSDRELLRTHTNQSNDIVREEQSRKFRKRLKIVILFFVLAYSAIASSSLYRGLNLSDDFDDSRSSSPLQRIRPQIVDRNGEVLAANIPTRSAYLDSRDVLDIDETIERLQEVFPDIDYSNLRRRLAARGGFVWIKRQLSPSQAAKIYDLGLPGLKLMNETMRFYPAGNLFAHVVGFVDIDNRGLAGIEKYVDQLSSDASTYDAPSPLNAGQQETIQLSLDQRVQFAVYDELSKAMKKFKAKGAAGLVMDVATGEILALVSLPDFDLNLPAQIDGPQRVNRMTVGVYEMGSTFKALTTAMAIDSGRFEIDTLVDARLPLVFGGATIRDFQGKGRMLTVAEAFIYSSNIAMARMAMAVGADAQKEFLRKLGQFTRLKTELPENAQPLVPDRWAAVTSATVAFGHGIAVAPLQAAMAVAGLVNGGNLIAPTFIRGAETEARMLQRNVVKASTGAALRSLMKLNAVEGSARRAAIDGYDIGGKTGSAEKVVNGRYAEGRLLTSFMGIVPASEPRYLFLTMLDEPQASPETAGYATSGWNAVPVTRSIMVRSLPALGLFPGTQMGASPVSVPIAQPD